MKASVKKLTFIMAARMRPRPLRPRTPDRWRPGCRRSGRASCWSRSRRATTMIIQAGRCPRGAGPARTAGLSVAGAPRHRVESSPRRWPFGEVDAGGFETPEAPPAAPSEEEGQAPRPATRRATGHRARPRPHRASEIRPQVPGGLGHDRRVHRVAGADRGAAGTTDRARSGRGRPNGFLRRC